MVGLGRARMLIGCLYRRKRVVRTRSVIILVPLNETKESKCLGGRGVEVRSFLDNIPRIICVVLRYCFYRIEERVWACVCVSIFVCD